MAMRGTSFPQRGGSRLPPSNDDYAPRGGDNGQSRGYDRDYGNGPNNSRHSGDFNNRDGDRSNNYPREDRPPARDDYRAPRANYGPGSQDNYARGGSGGSRNNYANDRRPVLPPVIRDNDDYRPPRDSRPQTDDNYNGRRNNREYDQQPDYRDGRQYQRQPPVESSMRNMSVNENPGYNQAGRRSDDVRSSQGYTTRGGGSSHESSRPGERSSERNGYSQRDMPPRNVSSQNNADYSSRQMPSDMNSRGGPDYSQDAYSTREMRPRDASFQGGYNTDHRSGQRQRDDFQRPSRNSYNQNSERSTNFDDRGSASQYGNDRHFQPSAHGGSSNGPRGGGSNYGSRSEYNNPSNDQYGQRQSYTSSTRGGGSTGYSGYVTSEDRGQSSARGGGSYSSGRGGGAFNSDCGGGTFGSGRGGGSFISGRGGGIGSRYEDRRNDASTFGGGYSGYTGFESGTKEKTEENHAPRDYKPHERNVEDIFNEDKEDVKRNNATIFDADADIEVTEVDDIMIAETWEEMNLHDKVLENVIKSDYVRPRKIQQYTIPYILEGFDVKCQGETGSGKTAAFLLPVIHKMLLDKANGQLPLNPICLVIAPTRELTSQIYDQAKKFTSQTGISVARAYGEYMVRQNINDIKNGCNILCACVGRLMHFVRSGDVSLHDVKYLVLDEADRLLQENSNSDVLQLFNWPDFPSNEKRQTLLFSATLRDPNVMSLTRQFLREKRTVMITAKNQSNKRVNYAVYAVPSAAAKFKYLVKYMKKITDENDGVVPKTLIFVNRKVNTDRVAIQCTTNGFPSTTIHGDRGQHLREEALASFRSGKTRCLVATDVCARGVDIKEMDHVINYDIPNEKDSFVQRCGRTGRTHNGTAMSFYLEDEDRSMGHDISRIIQEAGQEAPPFLTGMVQNSDYNFGNETEVYEAPPAFENSQNNAPVEYAPNNSTSPPPPVTSEPINDTTQDVDWD